MITSLFDRKTLHSLQKSEKAEGCPGCSALPAEAKVGKKIWSYRFTLMGQSSTSGFW